MLKSLLTLLFLGMITGVILSVLFSDDILYMIDAQNGPESKVSLPPSPTPKPSVVSIQTPIPASSTPTSSVVAKTLNPTKCVVDPNELAMALKKYSSDSQFEDTLLSIVSKIDCKKCSRKEQKTIVQVKMMMALKAGKQKTAEKYMKQLDTFVD